jgi:hypothetical protein
MGRLQKIINPKIEIISLNKKKFLNIYQREVFLKVEYLMF